MASRGTIYPWRAGNRFELLLDGAVFFPRMLAAIAAAAQQVEVELYLIEDGQCSERLVDALCRAAARGVRVRGLFDAYGAAGLAAPARERLLAAGVELRWYNPLRWRRGVRNFHRDHRKLLLVDGRLAYVGGTGATDEFWLPSESRSPWHEVMVEIEGPLVGDWQQLFEHQWRARFAWRPQHQPLALSLPDCPPAGLGLGRVAYADAAQHRDILLSLLRALRGPASASGWPHRTSCPPGRFAERCAGRRRAASRCACCWPAATPITRRCASPASATTPSCSRQACASLNTSPVSCT